MKNVQFEIDGSFEYGGTTIYYRIKDDNRPIHKVNGVEKLSRFIEFYNSNRCILYSRTVYGTIEEMQSISHFDAEKWYLEDKGRSYWVDVNS